MAALGASEKYHEKISRGTIREAKRQFNEIRRLYLAEADNTTETATAVENVSPLGSARRTKSYKCQSRNERFIGQLSTGAVADVPRKYSSGSFRSHSTAAEQLAADKYKYVKSHWENVLPCESLAQDAALATTVADAVEPLLFIPAESMQLPEKPLSSLTASDLLNIESEVCLDMPVTPPKSTEECLSAKCERSKSLSNDSADSVDDINSPTFEASRLFFEKFYTPPSSLPSSKLNPSKPTPPRIPPKPFQRSRTTPIKPPRVSQKQSLLQLTPTKNATFKIPPSPKPLLKFDPHVDPHKVPASSYPKNSTHAILSNGGFVPIVTMEQALDELENCPNPITRQNSSDKSTSDMIEGIFARPVSSDMLRTPSESRSALAQLSRGSSSKIGLNRIVLQDQNSRCSALMRRDSSNLSVNDSYNTSFDFGATASQFKASLGGLSNDGDGLAKRLCSQENHFDVFSNAILKVEKDNRLTKWLDEVEHQAAVNQVQEAS